MADPDKYPCNVINSLLKTVERQTVLINQLRGSLNLMVIESVNYAEANKLGDVEQHFEIQSARSALAAAEAA